MTKRSTAKYKIDRQLGINLWGRSKSPFLKRNTAPGQHGARRRKPSPYGVQLKAKQRLRAYYGDLRERQFHNIYLKARSKKGDTGENIIALLESRLASVVYRMKFASSPFAARQLVSHGHILVNGKMKSFASYHVKEGDEVSLSEKLKDNVKIIEAMASSERSVPSYIEVDHDKRKGKYLKHPVLSEVPYPVVMEPHLIVELYSR